MPELYQIPQLYHNHDRAMIELLCKKWMVVLTKVIVISVSLKVILSLGTICFQAKNFSFMEIDCIIINRGSMCNFMHNFTRSYQCTGKFSKQPSFSVRKQGLC